MQLTKSKVCAKTNYAGRVEVGYRLTGHGESPLDSRSPFITADSTNCLMFWVYKAFISSHRVSTSILSETIWHSQLVEKMWVWLMQWRWLSSCVCMQWIELATSLLGTNVRWLTDHVSTNKSLLRVHGNVRVNVWGRMHGEDPHYR